MRRIGSETSQSHQITAEYTIANKMANKELQMSTNGRPRGRPKLDFAVRVRNWIWYWLVKNELALSDDELDARFVHINADVRPRLFFRIRSMGSSPDAVHGYRSRKSLFSIVHEKEPERLVVAKKVFESELWDLLQRPQRTLEEYSELIHTIVARRGWFRATYHDLDFADWVLGDDEPFFETGIGKAHQAMFRHLAACQPDIEALTLLAAMFREAHAALELDIAIVFKRTLGLATKLFGSNAGLPLGITRMLNALVSDRVLYNRIFAEDSYEHLVDPSPRYKRSNRTRASQVKNFADNYWAIGSAIGSYDYRFPIVARTERLDWLIANPELVRQGGLYILGKAAEADQVDSTEVEEQARREWLSEHPVPAASSSGLLEGPNDWRLVGNFTEKEQVSPSDGGPPPEWNDDQ